MPQKKMLLIFEVQKTLLTILPARCPATAKPDFATPAYNVFGRPHARQMLQEFMTGGREWEVGLWTSLRADVVTPAVKHFFGPLAQKLLFVNTTRVMNIETVKLADHEPFAIARNLDAMHQQFSQYNPTNTVVISPFSNVDALYVVSEAPE